jgi:integrase/recombinase XerD
MVGTSLPFEVSGPLRPFAPGFGVELQELGYEWTSVRERMRLMAELSAWSAARGLESEDLTASLVGEFMETARARDPGKRWCSPASERRLLGYLRGLGLIGPPEARVVIDPIDRLIVKFVEYLVRERGLAVGSTSVYEYKRTARVFLAGRVDPDGGGLDRLTSRDVTGFVLAQCRRPGYKMSSKPVTTLRGLLRFLFLEGLTPTDLTGAVPGVARWRGGSLPKALPAGHVARLLASCDQSTAIGRRDFAVMAVLSRLGLRACEVAKLELGDVDWRAGELAVRGKQARDERLPLPADVGEALFDYLAHGRPDRKDPHLFLTARAPIGALTGHTIAMLVRSAAQRAGLQPLGVHRLRHTVATEVLRAGAPLEEVASLLRHRRYATTVIYAKVDWERLRQLARPWPGRVS